MNFAILCFLVLFCLPMAIIMAALPPQTLMAVAEQTGVAALLFVAALLLPRLLRPLRRRRERRPTARALARLDWPRSLTRGELENHCAAWLRSHGWQVTLASDPEKNAEAVFVMASHGDTTVAVLCDRQGEELNPATIRAFAHAATELGATRHVLLTLRRGKLPPPAEAAARQAGVRLLRIAELPQLDALAPAAAERAAAETAA
jgi:hypothetical protein